MSDIASLGIKVESNLKILNKDMEKTISLSEKVTDATKKMESQMAGVSSTTKNVITEEVKRQKSIDKIILSLSDQEKKLALSKNELNKYNLALLGASNAEKQHAVSMMKNIKVMQDEILSQKAASKAAQDHKRAMEASEKAMADANASAKKHDNVLGSLITRLSALGAAYFGLQAIKDFTKDVVLLSARYETLGVVVENVGKTAGYSMLEINEQSKALQKQGISMIQSRESITKLIQAHIDLSNAQKLGRIAQDAAVIGNVNSSHALERIVYGIQTAQIEVLKSVGLNVNFENSYKKLSIQLGKSTTDLTESEKTQARLNVVLERGADIAGTYEAAMTTAGKQITSFTRYLEDYKVIFGQAFNDATTKVIAEATKWMKELTETTGGSETQTGLKQFADGLGTILSVMLKLSKVGAEIVKYIGFIGNFSENLSIEQKGIELVNKGLIDQVKYTKATWEEKKKLISESEPIIKITKKIGEQTEGYNLYSESVKKSSKALRDAKKEEQDLLDKSLLDQKKARSEAEKAAKKVESEEKARQGRVDAIINKMKEQIVTYKQATEVSAEYQLKQEGASPAEIKLAKDLANTIDALKAKTKAQEAYKKVMDKTAPDPIEMNRQKSIEAVNQAVKDGAVLNGTYAESLAQINKHFDKMDMEKSDKALKEMGSELDKFTKFDGSSFGNTIADGINNAMISMNKLNDTFDNNAKAQALIIKLQKEISTGKGSPEERKEKLEQIDKAESKMITNQISGYRQLFGTASQLFKENSREREVMHNIEMAFAAAEIAMNLEKTISAAYLAIAESGTLPPPASFAAIAAMTALMAGIVAAAGGSLSGGGSASAPSVSASSTQGTGTVMGNPSEKSQSANNALEFMKDIEAKQYNELRDINKGVVDLNNNITNLVTSIVRTGAGTGDMGIKTGVSGGTSDAQDLATRLSLTGGAGVALLGTDILNKISGNNQIINALLNTLSIGTGALSDFVSNTISSVSNAVFGGTKKTSILAQGLEVSTAKIGDLLEGAGLDIQKFADIKIKKSGGLFGSDKTYLKTITQALEPEEEDIKIMFTNVFKNVGETMVAISKELNMGDENLAKIYAHVFDVGKIDLKGMDTEQINEAISSVINKTSDDAVTALFGELIGKYVQVGEALLETAIRVVSERAVVLDILEMTGQGFKDSDIPARSLEVTQSLISVAGGIKELQDASATYYDKFFSDEEKNTRLQGQLSEVMASMRQAIPGTRDAFKNLVSSFDLTTEAGQRGYVTLLGLSESFDSVYSKIEAEQEKKLELELQIMNLTGKGAEAIAIQRKKEIDTLSEANKPLQERIYALQDEAAALEKSTAEAKKIEEERAAILKKESEDRIAALKLEADTIKAINEKKFDLEIQILNRTGKESEALVLQRQKEIDSLAEVNKPLQERIYALTDEAKETERINSINKERTSLEIELLNATGKTVEATAMSRQIELASMDESLRSLKLQIWAANDLAAANELATTAENERIQILKEAAETAKKAAQEQLESAKTMLKDAVDAKIEFLTDLENKAKENLQVVKDLLQRSFEYEKNKIVSDHELLIKGLTGRLDEAKTAASDLEGVFNSLSSAKKSMFVAGSETDQYKEIQNELFKTLQEAISGDFSGTKALSERIGGLGGNNQSMFVSEQDYKRDFFKTFNALTDLEKLTGTQLTEQQQIVKNLETQIEITNTNHELVMEAYQLQYDAVIGLDESVVSFSDAVIRFQKAQYEADGANALLKEQSGILYNQLNALLGINSSVLSVGSAINNLAAAQLAMNATSSEATEIPAFASGGFHSGGLRIVGENGPEMEYTPPAQITSNNDLKSIMSNEEVVSELKAIRADNARVNFELVKNSGESKKAIREWQEIGILTRSA